MLRLILGILKGGLIGAAIGFGAWKAGLGGGALDWLLYGTVGALAGVLCGKAPWRQETIWTPVLKGLFGFGVGIGLFWGARKLFGDSHLAFATGLGAPDQPIVSLPFLLAPVIGAIYGTFVEIDDSVGKKTDQPSSPPATKP